VLKESNSNSGGAKSVGCPPSITRINVEPERGGESTKIAGGFFSVVCAQLACSGGIICLNSAICAAVI
jgi:hypothetical protein